MAGLMERIGATEGGVLDDQVYIQGSLRLDTEEAPRCRAASKPFPDEDLCLWSLDPAQYRVSRDSWD